MNLPAKLKPNDFERVKLPIRWFRDIPKATPVFRKWVGKKVDYSYGNKAVLDFFAKPEFAELGILRLMQKAGWEGVWVDTYRGKYRTQFWPSDEAEIPAKWEKVLRRIQDKSGSYGLTVVVLMYSVGKAMNLFSSNRSG